MEPMKAIPRRRQRNEEQKQKERQKNRLLEICKILDDDVPCLHHLNSEGLELG